MIVSLYIYIDGISKQIELFDDETISVTSSIQNINDISKVFTDYSNSFTIPASDNNNSIFKHWYENSIEESFDQRQRYDGYIEIDTQLFRVGKWQLESASIKNNKIEDYKIVFYGNLKSLTDAFGEDKLKDVETLNDYTIEYTGPNVKNSITSTSDLDIHFPLISSDRDWQYSTGGGGGSNNIHNSGGSIDYKELFPAIKLNRIFDAIATKYNVTFNGDFLQQSRFDNAFLWLKNGEAKQMLNLSEKQRINFTVTDTDTWIVVNSTNDTVTLLTFPDSYTESQLSFQINLTFPSSLTYLFNIYKNGALYTTLNGTGTNVSFTIDSNVGLGEYYFEIQTNITSSYTFNYLAQYFEYDPLGPSQFITLFSGSGSGTTNNNIDLTQFAPDIKVADFVSGVLKMFNLTAFSINGTDFTLEQLEQWYYQGDIKDFSEYCISDFEFNRIKPYKKIDLKYQKSENLLSRNFYDVNSREYGDASENFNNDGADYTIQLPFENLLFNKFTGTDLQVGYTLKPDLNTYAPKPIILYKYDNVGCDFQFDAGSGHETISNYNVFGQDVNYLNQIHTLNFGIEFSSFTLNPINNTLFSNYYLPYLSNLYSLKSRMLKVKMRLSYAQLLGLKLNDRIVIRDKRYIINQYTTDLTTFESDFELIQDFRSINFNNSRLVNYDNTEQALTFYNTSNEPLTWSIDSDIDSMISRVTDYDTYVVVELNINSSGLAKVAAIISDKNDLIIIQQDA